MTARVAGTAAGAPIPAGPYSHAVRVGAFIVTAGQTGIEPATGTLAGADVGSQARQAWKNTVAALASVGGDASQVVQVRVFLVALEDFEPMNATLSSLLPTPYPARTTVYVKLPPLVRIEIDVLAVAGSVDAEVAR